MVLDPLGVRKVVNTMAANASMLQGDILHHTKRTEQLIVAFSEFEKRMRDYDFLMQVKRALDASAPDMFWVKDLSGRYIIANKAIRDGLLFDEDPYGKTDRQIADKIISEVGSDKHTFGAICGNSDLEVVEKNEPQKFNEDGLVKGEYMMLQVHKNVVKDTKGNIIATVGGGRDITFQVVTLQNIMDTTTCEDTRVKIEKLLNHYKFNDRT